MRQYPVDAARHAQVSLGKVIAGVELQRCWNVTLDKQLFHRVRIVEYVPLENLYLSPQCGFASCEIGNKLTEDEQWAKIALVRRIAERVWK